MAIVVIDENTKEGRELIDSLRNKPYVQIIEDDNTTFPVIASEPAMAYGKATTTTESDDEDIPFERIPGLPYTHEERIESLRRAEEEPDSWLMNHEDFKKEMAQW